ncbi:hypothetical protein [Methanogenium cariaci]|uniref:hypothetical protein n=1 Tax=Methanogenium cariaci TaxID=2197 RepID=UPI0007827E7C|nr:hypothetical protein [Methanogenium cariaci]
MEKEAMIFWRTFTGFAALTLLMSLLGVTPVAAEGGEIVAWGGDDWGGQCSEVPSGNNFIMVDAGGGGMGWRSRQMEQLCMGGIRLLLQVQRCTNR